MRITRVYSPRVWQVAAFSHCLYNLTFWGGLIWLVAASFFGKLSFVLAALLTGIFLLGATTGWTRAVVASQLLAPNRSRIQKNWWAYVLLGPVVSILYLYNVFASAWNNRIIWRGIGYEMTSPTETTILHRPKNRSQSDQATRAPRKRKASVPSSSPKS
jgi:hypothetical protein